MSWLPYIIQTISMIRCVPIIIYPQKNFCLTAISVHSV